jgi:hypothetical protein
MNSKLVPAELLDPVVAYFNPRRVFGSVARGDDGRIAISIGVGACVTVLHTPTRS